MKGRKTPSTLMIAVGSPTYKRLIRKKKYIHNKYHSMLISRKNLQKIKIKDPSGRMILINGNRFKKLIKLGYKLSKEKTALVFPNTKEKG